MRAHLAGRATRSFKEVSVLVLGLLVDLEVFVDDLKAMIRSPYLYISYLDTGEAASVAKAAKVDGRS